MTETVTLAIPIHDGTVQIIDAVKVTDHFAVHISLDCVVFKDSNAAPWTITHIPTLCRIVFSDSQAHAEEVARLLEALPIDWNIQYPIKGNGKTKSLLMQVCRGLAAKGLAWAEWV